MSSSSSLSSRSRMSSVSSMSPPETRVIVYVDGDAFGMQVLRQLFPEELDDIPCALMASKAPNAKMLSVSYEAREQGVTKTMTAQEAIDNCPEIELRYHTIVRKQCGDWFDVDYSNRVYASLPDIDHVIIEKCGMDEFYLDITELVMNPNCPDYSNIASSYWGVFVETAYGTRSIDEDTENSVWGKAVSIVHDYYLDRIYQKTGFRFSAGISYNKQLAKIACTINKPRSISILVNEDACSRIFKKIPIEKVEGFGGNKGKEVIEDLEMVDITTLGELREEPKDAILNLLGYDDGDRLWEASQGIDRRPVQHIPYNGVIACQANFSPALDINYAGNINILRQKLVQKRDQLVQKLNSANVVWADQKREGLIKSNDMRVEVYTPMGDTFTIYNDSPIEYLSTNYYSLTDFLCFDTIDQIVDGVEGIERNSPQCIAGIRLVVLSAKKTK